jgi:two-component system sensor histidine kinase FlrB
MLGQGRLSVSDWPALAQAIGWSATDAPDEWQLAAQRVAIAESPLDSAGGRILLIHDITAAHELKARISSATSAWRRWARWRLRLRTSCARRWPRPCCTAPTWSAGTLRGARTRFAGKATAQLKRLERLIQDVLLFARGESIGRDTIPVRQLLADAAQTVEPLFRRQWSRLPVVGAADGNHVTGSPKALAGALVNLLENALQACARAGGKVTLGCQVGGA